MSKKDDYPYLWKPGDVYGIYVIDELIGSSNEGNIQHYLVHDKDTYVCYVFIASYIRSHSGGWTFSASPRYNIDGTIMKREDIISENMVEEARKKEELILQTKNIRKDFNSNAYPSWW